MKKLDRSALVLAGTAILLGFYLLLPPDASRSAREAIKSRLSTPLDSRGGDASVEGTKERAVVKVAKPKPQVVPERAAIKPLPAPTDGIRSPIADGLNRPEGNGVRDLAVVYDLFDHYRERYGAFPTGEDNSQIVNALTGNNPERLAFIDRTHPAISASGELLDRWGTAFVFHFMSHDALEIRSAGPDRELYTSDDLLRASPLVQALVAQESNRQGGS